MHSKMMLPIRVKSIIFLSACSFSPVCAMVTLIKVIFSFFFFSFSKVGSAAKNRVALHERVVQAILGTYQCFLQRTFPAVRGTLEIADFHQRALCQFSAEFPLHYTPSRDRFH